MATAKSVIDVILGEAKGGSWEDMLGVASVIYNRAQQAGVSADKVAKIPSQFNAYGKALPAGVGKYRSLAEKAWDQVQKTGPVHKGTYQMSGGLQPKVKGLKPVASVDGGHVYYEDPQARPIATTEGYRKPRFTDQMKMAASNPQLTGKAFASAEGSANLGMGRGLANLAPNGLRGVEMANAGATRSQPITSSLMSSINQAVENVYGPGYKAQVYSGGQPAKGTGGNRVGTIRHDGGKAGDTYIVDPNGKRLSGDALAPLAQYWAANKIGGVGLEMAGGGIHLDEWSTPPAGGTMAWSYNKLTPTQSSAIDQGLKGEWPQVAAFNRPPIPTPSQPMRLMAQAKAADRAALPQRQFAGGGILNTPKVSLNPVSSANAGERPQVTRTQLPAIRSGWTPADQTDRWNAPITPGNIDLNNRPIVKNSDGSISTVKSASFGIDGREVLLPTVSPSGVKLTDKGALSLYNATGKNLGQFRDANAANIYAQKLHEDQAAKYLPKVAAKTSTGVSYSLSTLAPRNIVPQAQTQSRPAPQMTPRPVSAPVQSVMRDRPMPSGPIAPQAAPQVSPQTMAAAYGQYAQTRMAAPSTPMQANPVVAQPRIQATGTAGTMTTPQIAGPIGAPIQANQFPAAPAKPTMKQKVKGTLQNILAPENLKAMSGQLAGGVGGSMLGGPIGGIIGGLIGKQLMSQPQGQGLLAGLFGGGNNGYQGQSTYIGNGVNAVDRAMYGNRAGDTATYNSQGGGTVTNLGNGSSQRTSSKYGWTETTHADGSKSIKYK